MMEIIFHVFVSQRINFFCFANLFIKVKNNLMYSLPLRSERQIQDDSPSALHLFDHSRVVLLTCVMIAPQSKILSCFSRKKGFL
jgi:hypothetical protein